MIDETHTFNQRRNNSTLSYADCYLRLGDESRAFEAMTDDDLDSIYCVAFGQWAYHMSRDGYIKALYEKRAQLLEGNRVTLESVDGRNRLLKEAHEFAKTLPIYTGNPMMIAQECYIAGYNKAMTDVDRQNKVL